MLPNVAVAQNQEQFLELFLKGKDHDSSDRGGGVPDTFSSSCFQDGKLDSEVRQDSRGTKPKGTQRK